MVTTVHFSHIFASACCVGSFELLTQFMTWELNLGFLFLPTDYIFVDWLSLPDKCELFGESHGQVGILNRCFYPNDFRANKWSVNSNVECGCIFVVLNIIPSRTEFECLP